MISTGDLGRDFLCVQIDRNLAASLRDSRDLWLGRADSLTALFSVSDLQLSFHRTRTGGIIRSVHRHKREIIQMEEAYFCYSVCDGHDGCRPALLKSHYGRYQAA